MFTVTAEENLMAAVNLSSQRRFHFSLWEKWNFKL